MNLRFGLLLLIGCRFAILVESVSDAPRAPIDAKNEINWRDDYSEEENPDEEKLSELDFAKRSFLGRGNRRTLEDLKNIREALKDLSRKRTALPDEDQSLGEIKKQPKYENVAGAPEKLSVINKNLHDYLFQTDILASPAEIRELAASQDPRQKRKAISDPKKKWPVRSKGVIPFRLDASLTPYKKSVIAKAIKFWEQNSCVTFKLNGKGVDKNSLNFYSGDGCYSLVGKVIPNQDLSIGDGCEYFGIVTHEIGHALGFYHEQERYDRDKYIEVVYKNIYPFDRSQFSLVKKMHFYGVPYDYGSIMHYDSGAFALNSSIPTIRALNPEYQQTMGQGRAPSFLDVLQLNRHYGCLSACRKSKLKCQNHGYPNPNEKCRSCVCPASFGGTLCETVAPPASQWEKCGGILNATDEWQTLAVSMGTKILLDGATTCFWHIKAPEDRHIEVQITQLNTTCTAGCFFASLELKTEAQFVQSGHVHCCITDNLNQTYTSKTNLVPVIAYADIALSFTIEYRLADKKELTTLSPEVTGVPSNVTTDGNATLSTVITNVTDVSPAPSNITTDGNVTLSTVITNVTDVSRAASSSENTTSSTAPVPTEKAVSSDGILLPPSAGQSSNGTRN